MIQQLAMFNSITDPPPAVAPWDDPATQPATPSAAAVSLFEIAKNLTVEHQQELYAIALNLRAEEQEEAIIKEPVVVPERVPDWLR